MEFRFPRVVQDFGIGTGNRIQREADASGQRAQIGQCRSVCALHCRDQGIATRISGYNEIEFYSHPEVWSTKE